MDRKIVLLGKASLETKGGDRILFDPNLSGVDHEQP